MPTRHHGPVNPESAATARRWSHLLIATVIAVSLLIQLVLVFSGGADANSGDTGETIGIGTRLWRLFSYFTIQSNLIVLVVAVLLVLDPRRNGRLFRVVRLDSLLGIVITGLVFAIVLAPKVELSGWALAATIGFHYISPWATLLVWLGLGPRHRIGRRTMPAAFAWPVGWLVYIFVQGAFTDWYPYPFLDADDLGLGTAIRNSLLVVVLGILLALAFKLTDDRLRLPRS